MRAHPRSLLSIILPLQLFSTQFGDEQVDLPNSKAGVGRQRSMAALRLIPVVPSAFGASRKRTRRSRLWPASVETGCVVCRCKGVAEQQATLDPGLYPAEPTAARSSSKSDVDEADLKDGIKFAGSELSSCLLKLDAL